MRRTEADGPGDDFSTGLEYHVLDVFTDTAFVGNPLAVVLGAESLNPGQLQTLAREFQLSETAFPMFGDPAVVAAGADYRLRIFTPEVELPFAGHPSVGTAWLVQALGLVTARDGQVIQVCGAGALPLGRDEQGRVELRGGEASLGDYVDPASVASAVGLRTDDLVGAPPRLAGTGIDFVVAPVRGGALALARPDLGVLRAAFPAKPAGDQSAASHSVAGVLIVAWDDETSDPPRFRVRMFAGDVGVAEDAATGSAALALGVFLVDAGRLPADAESRYVVSQGVEMGRPSVLRCRVVTAGGLPTAVFVSGDVVPVATGRVRVPVPD